MNFTIQANSAAEAAADLLRKLTIICKELESHKKAAAAN